MASHDAVIGRLGIEAMRELKAIAWFCDAGGDGKMPLIPASRRKLYEAGGELAALVEAGCVRLMKRTRCSTIARTCPALRMEPFGRMILLRAKAIGLDLEPPAEQEAA